MVCGPVFLPQVGVGIKTRICGDTCSSLFDACVQVRQHHMLDTCNAWLSLPGEGFSSLQ